MTGQEAANSDRPEEVVILVHGTFSADKNDEGERWWQVGSDFYTELSAQLPGHIRLVGPGEVFRWGGENSNVHRVGAGLDLRRMVDSYEERGVPYHIVAHSHGGTAVWVMLFQELMLRRKRRAADADEARPLKMLQNVITVGSPFTHLQKLPGHVMYRVLKPLVLISLLAGILWDMIFGGPTIHAVYAFVVTLMVSYFLSLLSMATRAIVHNQINIQHQRPADVALFSDRWLGLWSEDDEAIALLQAALRGSRTPPKLKDIDDPFPKSIFQTELHYRLMQPAMLVRRVTQKRFRVFLDGLLKKRAASLILGVQNLETVRAVEPWPHPALKRENALPPEVQANIRKRSDAALAASSGGARPALLQMTDWELEEAKKAFGDTNKTMVHTTYFDDPDVVRIIAERIRGDGA